MSVCVKITAVLFGSLGKAVQEYQQNKIEGLELVLYQNRLSVATYEKPSLAGTQEEEAVLLLGELEEINRGATDALQKWQGQQQEVFTIAIYPEVKEAENLKEKLNAIVDSCIVLPNSDETPEPDHELLLFSIHEILRNLAHLVINQLEAEVMVDFEDIKTVLRSNKTAAVGIGRAAGKERAMEVVRQATSYPFMHPDQLANSQRLLLNIASVTTAELEMDELTEITDAIHDMCGHECEIIFGHCLVDDLNTEIDLFMIAVQ